MMNNDDRSALGEPAACATDAPAAETLPPSRQRAMARVRVRNSRIHGRGVFAQKPIKQGERIIEQKGMRITHDECDGMDTNSVDSGHTFLFTLNDHYVIDTNRGGNAARWINHGCTPNCESEYDEDDLGRPHKDRIFINAARDIAAGEELTYDYMITLGEDHTDAMKKVWQCLCGAEQCTGTMLTATSD